MLIDQVKSVETPKCVIPTLVWFDSVDLVYGVLPHAPYLSKLSGFVFRGGVEDRKVHVSEGAGPSGSYLDELIGQVIEGAPEVLQDVASDGGDINVNVLDTDQVVDGLSRLRIALGSDYVGVGVEKGFEGNIQLLDVLFGPFDLGLYARQPVHEVYSNRERRQPVDQPREKTPKGLEIRIPTRGEFFRNLKKILRLPSTPDRPKK
jgi:hypothetical protein